tara:strand:+ start:323 stop:592 length:270 start_codon:yes stop_codon:yes gene_type:complete
MPNLLPINFLDEKIGIIYSKMKIISVIISVIISKLLFTLTDEILLKINKPDQEVRGPGNVGFILPMIPTIMRMKDNINKIISIDIFKKY